MDSIWYLLVLLVVVSLVAAMIRGADQADADHRARRMRRARG